LIDYIVFLYRPYFYNKCVIANIMRSVTFGGEKFYDFILNFLTKPLLFNFFYL
jgi:hypothetical protein